MACIKKRRGKWVVDWRDSKGRRHWETKPAKKAAQDRLAEILSGRSTRATDRDSQFRGIRQLVVRERSEGSHQSEHVPGISERA